MRFGWFVIITWVISLSCFEHACYLPRPHPVRNEGSMMNSDPDGLPVFVEDEPPVWSDLSETTTTTNTRPKYRTLEPEPKVILTDRDFSMITSIILQYWNFQFGAEIDEVKIIIILTIIMSASFCLILTLLTMFYCLYKFGSNPIIGALAKSRIGFLKAFTGLFEIFSKCARFLTRLPGLPVSCGILSEQQTREIVGERRWQEIGHGSTVYIITGQILTVISVRPTGPAATQANLPPGDDNDDQDGGDNNHHHHGSAQGCDVFPPPHQPSSPIPPSSTPVPRTESRQSVMRNINTPNFGNIDHGGAGGAGGIVIENSQVKV